MLSKGWVYTTDRAFLQLLDELYFVYENNSASGKSNKKHVLYTSVHVQEHGVLGMSEVFIRQVVLVVFWLVFCF